MVLTEPRVPPHAAPLLLLSQASKGKRGVRFVAPVGVARLWHPVEDGQIVEDRSGMGNAADRNSVSKSLNFYSFPFIGSAVKFSCSLRCMRKSALAGRTMNLIFLYILIYG